jgi:DNA-binding transcriptional MocR family regulator
LSKYADDRALELAAFPAYTGGPDLHALAALCSRRSIAAIYTMPTLHNPLGYIMSGAQHGRLIGIARQHDCAVIEDGTYAFLDASSAPTIYELAPERTCTQSRPRLVNSCRQRDSGTPWGARISWLLADQWWGVVSTWGT